MQEVLPPYRTVVGPGVGIEPRTPQNLRKVEDLDEDACLISCDLVPAVPGMVCRFGNPNRRLSKLKAKRITTRSSCKQEEFKHG
jgi:hypothetical protein